MHPYGQNAEKMVYIMLGRFDDFAGNTCIFIEDAVKMNEVEFNGKLPVWNDESWGYLYRKLKPEHENMIIVGWAVDICGQLPSMTAQLERVHQTYFGGTHQILLLLDTLEREEAFYCNRNGYLKRREGFFVYYDKGIPERMETVMENMKAEKRMTEENGLYEEEVRSRGQESYREYLNKQKGMKQTPTVYRHSYSSTILLLVVIGALGYSAFRNYEKMQNMEMALNQMDGYQTVMVTNGEKENSESTEQEEPVKVEEIVGNIAPLQTPEEQVVDVNVIASTTQNEQIETVEIETTQLETEQLGNTQEKITEQVPAPSDIPAEPDVSASQPPETAKETMSEAETYLAQGYYIVQQGDNLASICRKIYNTTAIMEQICKVNEIKNPDAIFAGQRLTLPN